MTGVEGTTTMCFPRRVMATLGLVFTVLLADTLWAQADAQNLLSAATEAAKSLRTATYEGRMEIRRYDSIRFAFAAVASHKIRWSVCGAPEPRRYW